MSANNLEELIEKYKLLEDSDKESFFMSILVVDNQNSLKMIRKNRLMFESFLCSEDTFLCGNCVKCFFIDNKFICVGCCETYCISCMSESYDNTKLHGWYCCKNVKCQELYDKDVKL